MSSRSAWIRASSVRSHCESTPAPRNLRGGNIIGYTMVTLYPTHLISNQKPSESEARRRSNPMTRQLTTGTGRLSEKHRARCASALHEDFRMYEMRGRAKVALRKGEFLGHRWGDGDGGRAGG